MSKEWGGTREGAGRRGTRLMVNIDPMVLDSFKRKVPAEKRNQHIEKLLRQDLFAIAEENRQTMEYDNRVHEYIGITGDGEEIHVSADVYAEEEHKGVSPEELESPETWGACIDGETVYIKE
jgi:hypothetical protein